MKYKQCSINRCINERRPYRRVQIFVIRKGEDSMKCEIHIEASTFSVTNCFFEPITATITAEENVLYYVNYELRVQIELKMQNISLTVETVG